ncbi:uncharacterized protein BX664DRAFT_336474 [Halteromyces radiatus]|uniref:uncharacterized protein n=1 Tax=Halteromyces radiatus TaxID=101107 RepID=UPI002220258B|nr:uncharacterized protein BX664DRAFT_336474 [Halteromyces radiatus]KAI8086672.1 hypothetical protein BX664DRAFT_336474 [Halteromyces radiatus]
MTNIDVLTDEWVKKLHFENRVDLNLQIPASGESMKVQVGDIPPEHIPQLGLPSLDNKDDFKSLLVEKKNSIPDPTSIPTSDSYLSSIVSSTKSNNNIDTTTTTMTTTGSCQGTTDCSCYKCQRQRRRAGTRIRMIPNDPNLTNLNTTKSTSSIQQEQQPISSPEISPTALTPNIVKLEPPNTPRPTISRNGSFVLRKKPSIKSYEKHLPRPTYSELDSIYRAKQQSEKTMENNYAQNDLQKYNKDSYEISWKDETGDDILSSLRTFQTIFDEKPHGNEGLSDLLEVRAKEIKLQKIHQEQELAQQLLQQQMEPSKPPKRSDCLTLSYRDGPTHRHLTLYHTMKMRGPDERMAAYSKAFQHCIRADSGLSSWIEKQSNQPAPDTCIMTSRPSLSLKKSTKKSILHLPGRKQKSTAEDLWLRTTKLTDSQSSQLTTSDNSSNNSNSSNNNNNNNNNNNHSITPIDVLSTANALMPTQSSITLNQPTNKPNSNTKPYDYVDTPSKPFSKSRNSVDKDSLTSMDMDRPSKSSKLWSSLGRRSSKSRSGTPSIRSIEKIYQPPASIQETSEPFEKALDDLCEILTHVDRSVLKTYLEQANGDYMKTLSVIRAEVTSGKL